MKAYGGVEVWPTHSLTSALDGGGWSASHLGRFTPRERAPPTHWIGGWVGPRAVLDAVVKRKIPSPRRESNHRTPIVQPVAQLLLRVLCKLKISTWFLNHFCHYSYTVSHWNRSDNVVSRYAMLSDKGHPPNYSQCSTLNLNVSLNEQ
jgi:hypothetical protein